jgi:serine/threonine protein kinase
MSVVFQGDKATPIPHQNGKAFADLLALRKYFDQSHLSRAIFEEGLTLGTGSFGRVRIVATPTPSGKKAYFALKILRKSEIIRLKQVNHIKAEKSILSRVSHPFIVNLQAAFQDDTFLYMLMEYIIGGELFSQLRRVNRFHDHDARFYASEIILALQYLHSKNIVYRDLKPENLLIDKDGHMKITDFGFAKHVESRTYTLCGTPEYLAPEIITSKGHGKPVDWWAVGILIYEMLCGAPPFDEENPVEIYKKILKGVGEVKFPGNYFTPKAAKLIKGLLKNEIEERLGCSGEGPEEIKRHEWFDGLDWNLCIQRKLKPPFIPGFRSANDTTNFDTDEFPDSVPKEYRQLNEAEMASFDDF